MSTQLNIDAFLSSLTGASKRTLITYDVALRRFQDTDIPINTDVFAAFDRFMATARYKVGPRQGTYSASTRHLYVSALRAYIEWAEVNDLLDGFNWGRATAKLHVNRGHNVRVPFKPKIPDPRLPVLVEYFERRERSAAGIHRMVALRDLIFVRILFDTGCRLSEALGLTRADVRDGSALEVWIIGKGDRGRWLFLTERTNLYIRTYCSLRTDTWPWLLSTASGRFQGAGAYATIKRAARDCGLPSNTSPHMFRHYRACQLLNAGMPIESVQEFLGHKSLEVTRKFYAHTYITTLRAQVALYRDAIDRLPESE